MSAKGAQTLAQHAGDLCRAGAQHDADVIAFDGVHGEAAEGVLGPVKVEPRIAIFLGAEEHHLA